MCAGFGLLAAGIVVALVGELFKMEDARGGGRVAFVGYAMLALGLAMIVLPFFS